MRHCEVCNVPLHPRVPKSQKRCGDCEPVNPPELIPPVYENPDGDLLYVDKINIQSKGFRYAIFYRSHKTKIDADITRLHLNYIAQTNRIVVLLALTNLIRNAAGMWKRVA